MTRSSCRVVPWSAALALLAMLAAAGRASANDETWVEGDQEDCTSPTPIEIYPLGTDTTPQGGYLDPDNTRGPAAMGTHEDNDGDAIWGSISVAESNTNDEGIVYVPIQGVYRESSEVSINDSKTIHGFSAKDVIVTADCIGTPPTAAFGITLSSADTVVIENLTIRGYNTAIDLNSTSTGTVILRNLIIEECTTGLDLDTLSGGTVILDNVTINGATTGIDLTGTSGGTLIVRNSTLDENTTGIADDGGSLEVQLRNTAIRGGSRGIQDVKTLTIVDSEISNQSVNAVETQAATSWRFSGSTFSHAGTFGVSVEGGGRARRWWS